MIHALSGKETNTEVGGVDDYIILQFLAHALRRPEDGALHNLIIYLASGCGKSMLVELLEYIFGNKMYKADKLSTLTSQWNLPQAMKHLVVLGEMVLGLF